MAIGSARESPSIFEGVTGIGRAVVFSRWPATMSQFGALFKCTPQKNASYMRQLLRKRGASDRDASDDRARCISIRFGYPTAGLHVLPDVSIRPPGCQDFLLRPALPHWSSTERRPGPTPAGEPVSGVAMSNATAGLFKPILLQNFHQTDVITLGRSLRSCPAQGREVARFTREPTCLPSVHSVPIPALRCADAAGDIPALLDSREHPRMTVPVHKTEPACPRGACRRRTAGEPNYA